LAFSASPSSIVDPGPDLRHPKVLLEKLLPPPHDAPRGCSDGWGNSVEPRHVEEEMTVRIILEEKGRDVTTVGRETTLMEAARVLTQQKIGAVVVVDPDRQILGILSERDIVRAIAERGRDVMDQDVASVMTRKVVQCREESSINEVMEIMTNGRFRHLPVAVDGRLAGIISIGDVVRRRIQDVEREAEDMKAYIAS
jgi:CBS domain-containing protein